MNLTRGNADNVTEAIHGLDIFTKNWCMDCKQTEAGKDLVFRCKGCEFEMSDGRCVCSKSQAQLPIKRFWMYGFTLTKNQRKE